MAKSIARFKGDIGQVTDDVVGEILRNSDTSEIEERQDTDGIRIRIIERYSAFSGSRLSMSLVFIERDGYVYVFAATTGGSKAILIKIDTVGEGTFMDLFNRTVIRLGGIIIDPAAYAGLGFY